MSPTNYLSGERTMLNQKWSPILDNVKRNSMNPAYRCFYVDRMVLRNEYYRRIADADDRHLLMTIAAAPPGENVAYFGGIVGVSCGVRGREPREWGQAVVNASAFSKGCPHGPQGAVYAGDGLDAYGWRSGQGGV